MVLAQRATGVAVAEAMAAAEAMGKAVWAVVEKVVVARARVTAVEVSAAVATATAEMVEAVKVEVVTATAARTASLAAQTAVADLAACTAAVVKVMVHAVAEAEAALVDPGRVPWASLCKCPSRARLRHGNNCRDSDWSHIHHRPHKRLPPSIPGRNWSVSRRTVFGRSSPTL